jgi:hypothetical protein
MSFEQAREYLARVLPWPQDGDAPAFVNIHWTFPVADRTQPAWAGRAARNLNEAVKAVEYAMSKPDTLAIYACMSTARNATERSGKNNYVWYSPIRNRENAATTKALFLDLDFKDYAEPADAVTTLGNYLHASGMPKPSLIVSTGGGMHVYWTLDRALTVHEWEPLARALAESTKQLGLKCDTQCTVDFVRVLRIPNTVNKKTTTPRPVSLTNAKTEYDYSVEHIAKILEPYKVAAPQNAYAVDVAHFPPRQPVAVGEIALGIEDRKAPPVDIDALATECPFIADALNSGGVNFTNPLWNLTTLISVFCEDGRAQAHRMASQHAGYTHASTDELFNRKEKERERGIGWPSCATISGAGAVHCSQCRHFQKGRSPLNFTPRPQPSTPPMQLLPNPVTNSVAPHVGPAAGSDVPQGYLRRPDGVIVRLVVDPTTGMTEQLPLCKYPMELPFVQDAPWVLHFSTVLDNNRTKRISLPFDAMSTEDGLTKQLWNQGIPIRKHESKNAKEFMSSWIETLQKQKGYVINSVPFGWNVQDGKIEGFCFGGYVWSPSGGRPAVAPDHVIGQQYEPSGAREPWMAAAKLITDQDRPALDAILASAFAAPLVRFTGHPGLQMSCYSLESGIGKTTALKVAQAVWGDPVRAMQGLSDTQNSVLHKIGEIRSLPLYWDELKTEDDTKRFVNLTFQLSLGKEKSRMTSGVTQRSVGTWQTILVSASNESLLDYVTSNTKMTTAGLYRVFEYEVPPAQTQQGQIAMADAQLMIAELHDNYGVIGLEYAKFLGANHARIKEELTNAAKAITDEVTAQKDERFWVTIVTCILMGAAYANEQGFTNINLTGLKAFLLETLAKMRGERNNQPVDMKQDINVSNVMTQFLNQMRARHTLFTNVIHLNRGKPLPGSVSLVNSLNDHARLDAVYVHVGVDSKMMRFSSTAFTNWLNENGYARHVFTQAIEKQFCARYTRGRLGGGTRFSTATEYLYEIDLRIAPLLDFIDEA